MFQEASNDQGWLASLFERSSVPNDIPIEQPCEMFITMTRKGVKDFAVAVPKGSQLRWAFFEVFRHLENLRLGLCDLNILIHNEATRVYEYFINIRVDKSIIVSIFQGWHQPSFAVS